MNVWFIIIKYYLNQYPDWFESISRVPMATLDVVHEYICIHDYYCGSDMLNVLHEGMIFS